MGKPVYSHVFLTTSSVTPPMYNNNRIFFLRCATVSLRLGHSSALELHWSSIHSLAAASLPHRGRLLFMLYFFKNIVLYSSGKAFVCTNIAVGDGAFDIP